eukprot:GHRR01030511.1.p1 GENE.GHRR01030511.1~~GHRR01030511.1.p1  ORF type:complete len:241 (+),score=71.84 GHRR01030511.1:663-1385(+)
MVDAVLQQMREDALTCLVLWATTQEYSADIEALLKQWAVTFQIPDSELMQHLTDATSGQLQRPPDSRTGLGHSLELQVGTPTAVAATAGGPFASNKRAAADGPTSSKRYKVLRYWPKDAARNKGDPWFSAVVTDYEEDTGAHILTYQFGTQKEEKERVSLALKKADELRLMDEVIDLLEWYGDPKKRRKSSAVEKSVYVRKQYQALHGAGLAGSGGGARSKGGKGSKAHSNSAVSSGYSL